MCMKPKSLDSLLAEQAGYYRAVAAEYEGHSIPLPGGEEVVRALDEFKPAGRPARGRRNCSGTRTT